MQCETLMAMVTAGPETLELRSVVQFRTAAAAAVASTGGLVVRDTKVDAGYCALSDFIEALSRNDTIVKVRCHRHFTTGLNNDEWRRILLAFGGIPRLQELVFVDGGDSRLRRIPIEVVADVVIAATKLRKLEFGKFWLVMGTNGHRQRFAQSLHCHPTLEAFSYTGCGLRTQLFQAIAPRSHPCAVLCALSTCPNIKSIQISNSTYCAPDYSSCTMHDLLGWRTHLKELAIVTCPSNWVQLTEAMFCRQRSTAASTLERLVLFHSGKTATFQDIFKTAGFLETISSLQHVCLRFWGVGSYFPRSADENGGPRASRSFAEVVRRNKALRTLELSDCSGHGRRSERSPAVNLPPIVLPSGSGSIYSFDATDFNILAEAIRENGSVQVFVDVALPNDSDQVRAAYDRLRMESHLNAVGRNNLMRLSSVHGSAYDWCGALSQLNDLCHPDDGPLLLSCHYELMRIHPLLCDKTSPVAV